MGVSGHNNIPLLINAIEDILYKSADMGGFYLERKLVKKIQDQDPNWTELAAATIARKQKLHPGETVKIYIDTSELMGLITHQVGRGIPTTCEIGIFNHEKGLIAHYLEYGTATIPERPLFRLVFAIEGQNAMEIVKANIRKGLEEYIS